MNKIILPLCFIAGFRFFGLFVVLPTLAIYIYSNFAPQSAFLVGFAISSYALSQIIFQIPFGYFGDKYSKRNIIAFGLVIFACGSFICAFADSLFWLIIGRLIQGAGAIGSVVSAKIADLVKEEKRGSAMAFMGIAIFASFVCAMIIGPIFERAFGMRNLFIFVGILAILIIFILYIFVPKAPHLEYNYPKQKSSILINKNLAILNISVMVQKFLLTLFFSAIPLLFSQKFHISISWLFIIGSICGILSLGGGMMLAEKRKKAKAVLIGAIILFAISFLCLGLGNLYANLALFLIGVAAFFAAFCVHEPILQNLASKYPKISQKSNALGIFTTFGYIGSFFGGICGALLLVRSDLFWALCLAMLVWIVLMLFLDNPKFRENLYISVDSAIDFGALDAKINAIIGVVEAYLNRNERLLIVKFDNKIIAKNELEKRILEFL